MSAFPPIALVANTRLPSQRAQGLQVVETAAAFARAGAPTTLLYAKRRPTVALPGAVDVFDYYATPAGPRPVLEAVPCIDWIDRVPRVLQYVPARLQEQSFARNAARLALAGKLAGARVLSREIETGHLLARKKHALLFLEIHRVPGGRLRRRWLLEAARGARGVLAISGGVRDELEALGVDPSKLRVEQDGFESRRFANLPTRAVAREGLDLPRESPLVVYTGGLLEWKGVDLLVEVARTTPDVYFVIAGGMDGDVKRLRQRAGGLANVRIDGFQAPERVPLYLVAGDVGVVPNRSKPAISARYTSPLKVFESMAAGLPLVASDLPALRELLQPERDAVLVAPDDVSALRAGIERLLGDADLRATLSARMRSRAAGHTWDARATRILAWMETRADRRGQSA